MKKAEAIKIIESICSFENYLERNKVEGKKK